MMIVNLNQSTLLNRPSVPGTLTVLSGGGNQSRGGGMSALERIEKMSTGKLVLIGIIGFAWLVVLMATIVGTVAVLTMKSWLPKTAEQAMERCSKMMEQFAKKNVEVEVEGEAVAEPGAAEEPGTPDDQA